MAVSATRLTLEMDELRDKKSRQEQILNQANTSYTISSLGFFIGILLAFVGFYGIGGLLFVAGALGALTQGSKKRKAKDEIGRLNAGISRRRKALMEMEG